MVEEPVDGVWKLLPGNRRRPSRSKSQTATPRRRTTHLLHSVNNLFSPRIGVAWDPTGNGDWVVRGGFGIYNNWLTQANVQEEFRGSPPGEVSPTFFAGGTATAQAPIFVLGTGSKPPFGFTFPTFGPGTGPTPQSGGGLNAQGGVVGASFAIGGINPLLKSPKADIWSLSVERKTRQDFRGHRRLQRIPLLQHRRQRQLDRQRVVRRGHQRVRRRSDHQRTASLRAGSIPASERSPMPTTTATATTRPCSLISRALLARIRRCFLYSFEVEG